MEWGIETGEFYHVENTGTGENLSKRRFSPTPFRSSGTLEQSPFPVPYNGKLSGIRDTCCKSNR
jgi:hypothetical protein